MQHTHNIHHTHTRHHAAAHLAGEDEGGGGEEGGEQHAREPAGQEAGVGWCRVLVHGGGPVPNHGAWCVLVARCMVVVVVVVLVLAWYLEW